MSNKLIEYIEAQPNKRLNTWDKMPVGGKDIFITRRRGIHAGAYRDINGAIGLNFSIRYFLPNDALTIASVYTPEDSFFRNVLLEEAQKECPENPYDFAIVGKKSGKTTGVILTVSKGRLILDTEEMSNQDIEVGVVPAWVAKLGRLDGQTAETIVFKHKNKVYTAGSIGREDVHPPIIFLADGSPAIIGSIGDSKDGIPLHGPIKWQISPGVTKTFGTAEEVMGMAVTQKSIMAVHFDKKRDNGLLAEIFEQKCRQLEELLSQLAEARQEPFDVELHITTALQDYFGVIEESNQPLFEI